MIRVEDLKIGNMTRLAKGTRGDPGRNVRAKAGLNREILGSGWGLLVRRLADKAPGRVEKVRLALDEPAVFGVRAGGPGLAENEACSGALPAVSPVTLM